ncbi:MAG TPA: Hsp70 family protein [Polyangiaceae bacterium]|nr:Hsp70 family protein [Polyangiaceae bacterium]
MSQVVGIDLGTTNTVVATLTDTTPRVITDEGRALIPSVVWFSNSGQVVVGEAARGRRMLDPKDTVFSVKRLIGRPWDCDEVQLARKRFPFDLQEGPGKATLVAAAGQTFTLPEISAFVLRKAKMVAEASLGTTVQRAVITVPANFNDLQRAATKVAGRVAGLEVMRLLNEPTAAALAYGLGRQGHERIAVYDFGGGTFDLTVLDLNGKVVEVLATAGDTFLGGDDIDAAIADRIAEVVQGTHGVDPRARQISKERLRAAAERVKMALTERETFSEHLPAVAEKKPGNWVGVDFSFTRAELDQLMTPLIASTLEVCKQALALAGVAPQELNQVLLVGGSTRSPLVKRNVELFFGVPVRESANPDQIVAMGAAVQAAALDGTRGSAAPYSRRSALPPGPDRGPSMFPKDSGTGSAKESSSMFPKESSRASSVPGGDPPSVPAIPELDTSTVSTLPRKTSAADDWAGAPLLDDMELQFDPQTDSAVPELYAQAARPQRSIAPAEQSGFTPLPSRVAVGPGPTAAVSDSGRPPSVTPPLLVDVTPLSLSVETLGGYCDRLIGRNSPVPSEESRVFITTQDQQTKVVVRVCQGESGTFAENTCLGEVELTGLEPKPRGKSQVRIHFELDANGMLQVGATDLATNRQARVRLRLLGVTDADNVAALAERQTRLSVS